MSEVAMPTSLKIQAPPVELERIPLVANQRGPGWISDHIAGVVEGKTPTWWWCAFIPSFLCMMMLTAFVVGGRRLNSERIFLTDKTTI